MQALASSDSDFLPAKHVKLNRCWFRALSGTMNIISSNSYQKGEIELRTHSTILLQNLFAGSNYPWGRYYLPKINAKQISFPSSLAEGLKIHLFNTKWA